MSTLSIIDKIFCLFEGFYGRFFYTLLTRRQRWKGVLIAFIAGALARARRRYGATSSDRLFFRPVLQHSNDGRERRQRFAQLKSGDSEVGVQTVFRHGLTSGAEKASRSSYLKAKCRFLCGVKGVHFRRYFQWVKIRWRLLYKSSMRNFPLQCIVALCEAVARLPQLMEV